MSRWVRWFTGTAALLLLSASLTLVSAPTVSAGAVGSIGTVTTFSNAGLARPAAITTGPDGHLWYTDGATHGIGRVTSGGTFLPPVTSSTVQSPKALATLGDSLWFGGGQTYFGGEWPLWENGHLGSLVPDGAISVAPRTTGITEVAVGSEGTLAILDAGGLPGTVSPPLPATIQRLAVDGSFEVVASIPYTTLLPSSVIVDDLAVASDGAIWFVQRSPARIGRVDAAGDLSYVVDPAITAPTAITEGGGGAMWFTNASGPIGRVTATGTVDSFVAPGDDRREIAKGPDGNVWFTNRGSNSIGRVSPSGQVTTFTDVGIGRPTGITAGPDGGVWFTNDSNDSSQSIGRIEAVAGSDVFSLTARVPTSRCVGYQSLVTSIGLDTSGQILHAGILVLGALADAGLATPFVTPPANDGPCEITLNLPVDELDRITEIAEAWNLDHDQLAYVGGEIILAILWVLGQAAAG
jgi:virginiamycin B lyase